MDTLIFVATSREIALRQLDTIRSLHSAAVRAELESQTLAEHCVFVVDCRETTHPSTPFVQQIRVAK